ncbi:MAG: hypothetical protein Q8934_09660 [Bacillota bacterium]|nr:hypothetical protein [Bacillota bacterium]
MSYTIVTGPHPGQPGACVVQYKNHHSNENHTTVNPQVNPYIMQPTSGYGFYRPPYWMPPATSYPTYY